MALGICHHFIVLGSDLKISLYSWMGSHFGLGGLSFVIVTV